MSGPPSGIGTVMTSPVRPVAEAASAMREQVEPEVVAELGGTGPEQHLTDTGVSTRAGAGPTDRGVAVRDDRDGDDIGSDERVRQPVAQREVGR